MPQRSKGSMDEYTRRAFEHIQHLSVTIGGRGSCTPGERRAAEYAARQMKALGVQSVRAEPYRGMSSTYRPGLVAVAVALLGTLLVWLADGRWAMIAAALLGALGTWGVLAETDLATNWMRLLLPRSDSQNAIGIVPPTGPVQRRAVLCAHLDTHRTPVFYSSTAWFWLFGLLAGGAVLSMAVEAVAYGLGAALAWEGARWIGLGVAPLQLVGLALSLYADLTPFSPGANDDASGVGLILGLAERLGEHPLSRTEVWLAFTGCEETGTYGMSALLDRHAVQLGSDAVYVILDQVAIGQLAYLTADGTILKHKTHPHALELARRCKSALSELPVREIVGLAYTDALAATKRGLVALALNTLPPPASKETDYWHQMADTPQHVDASSLAATHAFAWQLLQEIDRS